jgi:TldD protein
MLAPGGDAMKLTRRDFLEGAGAAAAVGATALLPGCRTQLKCGGVRDATPAGALEPFGVTEATARKVMARALASGGEHCDLFFQEIRQCYLVLEDGAVNKAMTRLDRGAGVRVVRGVETGYAYSESLDERSLLAAAEVAAAVASGPAREVPAELRVGAHPSRYPVQRPWAGVPTPEKVKLLLRMQELASGRDRRIRKLNISHLDEDRLTVILDSSGRTVVDQQPLLNEILSCTAEQNGRRESNYAMRSARAGLEFLTDARLRELADEAVRRTVVLFEAVPGPVGELPLVLGPGSSGILLHEAIGHGMEADFARKRITIYSDMIGKRIAPDFVTIVDDGTTPGWRGSLNVDDEGAAGERTVLVERGVLRTFLHDQVSARFFKATPTGSGRRESFRHIPIPRMRNTFMLGGPHGRDEIVRSVKRGIYAEHFTNGQVLIGAGDFTFYIKNGYLIEDGKLTRPIKDVNIIGNGPEVLRRVAMVGPDEKLDLGSWTCGKRGQSVPVGLGLPTVKIAAITVGGTELRRG